MRDTDRMKSSARPSTPIDTCEEFCPPLVMRFKQAGARCIKSRIIEHIGWLVFFYQLSPIIGPHDYGLFITAISGLAIAEALLSETAAQAIIRLPRLTRGHMSAAFVAVIGVGAAISLAIWAIAGSAAVSYDDSAVPDIVQSLSLIPLLGALSVVPKAVLRRHGVPGPLALGRAVGVVFGGLFAIIMVTNGAGPWSLVVQVVTQQVAEILLLWGIAGQRIGARVSREDLADLAAALDGAAVLAGAKAAVRYFPGLVAGLLLGPVAAGLTLVGMQLLAAVDALLLPAAVMEPDQRAAAAGWRATAPVVPLIALVAVLPIAIPALLDPRWWGAVMPAQIMLAAAIPIALARFCDSLAPASSKMQVAALASGIVLTILAAPFGLAVLASAIAVHALLLAVFRLVALRRTGADSALLFDGMTRGLIAAAIIGGSISLTADPVGMALEPAHAVLVLLGIAVIGSLVAHFFSPGRPAPGRDGQIRFVGRTAGSGASSPIRS